MRNNAVTCAIIALNSSFCVNQSSDVIVSNSSFKSSSKFNCSNAKFTPHSTNSVSLPLNKLMSYKISIISQIVSVDSTDEILKSLPLIASKTCNSTSLSTMCVKQLTSCINDSPVALETPKISITSLKFSGIKFVSSTYLSYKLGSNVAAIFEPFAFSSSYAPNTTSKAFNNA